MKTGFPKKLLAWYRLNARDLPWRRTRDPYKIWVSEVMLQQTTVAAVIPYYQRWIKLFPKVEAVAAAPTERILRAWQGLGDYQRARNLQAAARVIVRDYKGKVPRTPEALSALPGFGPYTTGAVLSIAFDRRVPIIDANIRRVMMRQLGVEGQAAPAVDTKVRAHLEKIMPVKGNAVFNQAMMELGALVCRSREPLCNICPVRRTCRAFTTGRQELIPRPKKLTVKQVKAAIAVIRRNGKYLIQRRPDKGLLAGLWEFPGGKIGPRESARQALEREVREETGASLTSAKPWFNVKHYYTQFCVDLNVWLCTVNGAPRLAPHQKWVDVRKLTEYPMPSGSAKIVEAITHPA